MGGDSVKMSFQSWKHIPEKGESFRMFSSIVFFFFNRKMQNKIQIKHFGSCKYAI